MPDPPLEPRDDRPLADHDRQRLEDSDQVGSHSDQAAADADQAASESDQAAADRDQAASDLDLSEGGDRRVHDASEESRDHSTVERRRGGYQRAAGASVRDLAAEARDRAAEARDRAADERDREVDEHDERAPEGSAADRRRAASARRLAAVDRKQAAEDREHAALYRIEAQDERAALRHQVAVSETDVLTGARARAPGLRDLEVEINRARRTTGRLTVAYVDLIGLKAVNDAQGHSAGDALLEAAVQVMRSHLRSYDVIMRIGGDEFVCVMSGATVEDSRQRLVQIQAEAAASGFGLRFGIAQLESEDAPSDLIERADSHLLGSGGPATAGPVSVQPRPVPDVDCARILVTDDRPELAAVVSSALAERYSCDFAGGLEEAAEILANNPFELLLCDLHSGGDAALSLARTTIEANLDTAVILLAEDDDPGHASKAFGLGVFGYVVRPLPGQLLIATMNALRRRDLEIAHRRLSRDREDRRQAIIDMIPIAIFAKDRSGHYLLANAKAEELAGMERGELLGKTDEAFLSPGRAASYMTSDDQILTGVSAIEREDTIEYEGDPRTFRTTRFPLYDDDGAIVAIGGVAVDVSAEREAIRLRDRSIEELEVSRRETVERLARAIDRHDASTGQHVNRLAALTAFLGTKLGLDPDSVDLLRNAAPMHDVGKIGTPDEILRKPEPLSAAERSVMEEHTLTGHQILVDSKSGLLRLAATIALTHHERYDGSGYPNGLVGEAIPLEGRITAVADVFDALLSDRAYRPALPVSEAVSLLAEGRGTQFDPEILDLLLGHLDQALALRESAP
jgi:diguanylate cyclase (GGDEF)-like protein/PAS domain S-box-containing protein